MKAIAIILVVIDHLNNWSQVGGDQNPYRIFIYSLHMPLFFMVSGCLAYRKINDASEIFHFIKNKFRILVPLAAFSIGDIIFLKASINEIFTWHKYGLWFLWVLFLFFLIYALTQFILLKTKKITIELCVYLISAIGCIICKKYSDTYIGGIFNFLNLYNYVFFLLGIVVVKYKLKHFILKDFIHFGVLVIYIVSLFLNQDFLNLPMKACGILFIYGFLEKISNNNKEQFIINEKKIEKSILTIGSMTLYIYILHFYFIRGINNLPFNIYNLSISSPLFFLIIYGSLSLIVIGICIILTKILNTNKIIRIVFFGAKN